MPPAFFFTVGKGGRNSCRRCQKKIEGLKVGYKAADKKLFNFYHDSCFVANEHLIKISQLENLTSLDKDDQTSIKKSFKSWTGHSVTPKKDEKKGKTTKKGVKKAVEEEETKGVENPGKRTRKATRKVLESEEMNVEKPKSRKRKRQEEEEEEEGTQEKTVEKDTKKSTRASKRVKKEEEIVDLTVATKKSKTKTKTVKEPKAKKSAPKTKKKAAPAFHLTASQKQDLGDAKDKYGDMNMAALKDILKKNDQKVSGTKSELVERCADGKVFGKIPRCSSCGGGKLKFDKKKGTYSCPGYMEDTDFVHCGSSYSFTEITREKWTE